MSSDLPSSFLRLRRTWNCPYQVCHRILDSGVFSGFLAPGPMLCLFRWLTDASDEIKQSSFPPNTVPPSHYYKQSTLIVAEPPYKLLKLHASLMRRVFVTAMVQRRAGDHAEHPKFAAVASMGIRWFQASCHLMIHCQQDMLHVFFNDFREVKDAGCGSHADSVLAAVWFAWSRLGSAFVTQVWKISPQI